jgi:hypothetical protein
MKAAPLSGHRKCIPARAVIFKVCGFKNLLGVPATGDTALTLGTASPNVFWSTDLLNIAESDPLWSSFCPDILEVDVGAD